MSGLEKAKQHAPIGFTIAGTTTETDDPPKSHVHLTRPSWSLIGGTTKKDDTSGKTTVPAERSSMRKARERMANTVSQDDDEELKDGVKDEGDSFDDSYGLDSDFVDGEGGNSDAEFKDGGDSSDMQELLDEEDDDDDYKLVDDTMTDNTSKKRRAQGGSAYKFLCNDDGDEMHYQKRLSEWAKKRRHLRWRVQHVRSIDGGFKFSSLQIVVNDPCLLLLP